jgi:hypothetical protein
MATRETTDMKSVFETFTRRSALAATAAAAALAAIAHGLFTGPAASLRRQAIPIPLDERKGYRVTEHVRRYYRSTWF